MTDKYLNNLLNTLNKKQRKEHIFIRELDGKIDLAKVYIGIPKMTDSISSNDLSPYNLFCIKNMHKKYVGIVLDMGNDLHWFVKKKHRGNGYLTKALKESILPYIFQHESDEQRITINKYEIGEENFKASQKVALNVGFKLKHKNNDKFEYKLQNEEIEEVGWIEGNNKELSQKELKEIAKKVSFYSRKLIRLHTHLEMRYGMDNETIYEFKEQIKSLRYFAFRIEDISYENKKI